MPVTMQKLRRKHREHEAEPVQLAQGWIGICAGCGWVSRDYGSEEQAAGECASHVANAAEFLDLRFKRATSRRASGRRRPCRCAA